MIEKRVTVDFDSESYYLDGEFWDSWDNYGEEMADTINKELNSLAEENNELKQSIFDWQGSYDELYENNLKLERENKELKEKIQLLQIELNADAKHYQIFIDIIDEADDLICSHLSKHYQRKWRTFCKNKEYDFE